MEFVGGGGGETSVEEAAALLPHPPTQITPASSIGAATTPGGARMTLSTILIGILPSVFFGVAKTLDVV